MRSNAVPPHFGIFTAMKRSTRRNFIGAGAAAAGAVLATTSVLGTAAAPGTTASPAHMLPAASRPPVIHHVFFWLKNPSSIEDRDKLVAGLKTLAGIPLIKELYVGVLAATEKRDVVDASWQVSELMFFHDLQGQASYQQHPLHLDFVKNCSPLWEKVVVYDAMNVYAHIS